MFDTIDPKAKIYLKRIMKSIFVGLFWMFANVIAGIFLELGFIGQKFSLANGIYYAIAIITFILLLRFYFQLWKHDFIKR